MEGWKEKNDWGKEENGKKVEKVKQNGGRGRLKERGKDGKENRVKNRGKEKEKV